MKRKAVVLLGSVVAIFCGQVHAQSLADQVPADALVYLGWGGADAMRTASANTHLDAVLKESRMGELFGTYFDQIEKTVVEREPQSAEAFRLVRSIGAPIWKYPTALYVGKPDFTDKQKPHYSVALLTQAGDKADGIVKDIQNLLPEHRSGMPEITVSAQSGIVTLLLSSEAKALDLSHGALATSASFTSNFKQVRGNGVMNLFVDFQSMVDAIETGVGANAKDVAPKVKAFLDASGLRGVKQLVASAGFEGKDWVEETFVATDSKQVGLLKTVPAGPFDMSLLKSVPADATSVTAFRFDPAALTGELRNTLAKTDPTALQYYNYAFGGMQQALGANVEQSVLAPLGPDWLMYGSPRIGSGGMLGVVIVNKLDDPAAMKKGLNTVWFNLTKWANIAISKAKLEMPLSIKTGKVKIGDADVFYLAAPLLAPSWAIDDGKLYIGFYPQTVGSAIRQAHSIKSSILDSEKFQAALKTIKQEKLEGFSFTDLPTSAQHGSMYNNLLLFGRYIGIADLFLPPAPEPMVPPIDVILDNLAPAASGSWSDASGYHARSVQSFPGASMLHGDTSAFGQSLSSFASMGTLLPSLNRARETADRVKSAANLRQIGMGVMMHANENRGKFPESIDRLMLDQLLMPAAFDNPRNGPMVIPPDLTTPDAIAQYVAEHSDYIYVGAGKEMRRVTAETVVAYENPEGMEDGINILFGDGHVEFMNMPAAMQLIEQQVK